MRKVFELYEQGLGVHIFASGHKREPPTSVALVALSAPTRPTIKNMTIKTRTRSTSNAEETISMSVDITSQLLEAGANWRTTQKPSQVVE